MDAQLAQMRVDYRRDELDVGDLAGTWHEQLARWLDDATAAGVVEPNAMVLATARRRLHPQLAHGALQGRRRARRRVLHELHLGEEPRPARRSRRAAATFPWYAQQRQVSLRGTVERVAPEETRAYWATRPRGSQLGAWASAQSTYVRDRHALDAALAATEQRFADADRGAGAAALGRVADRPGAGRVLAGPGRTGCTTGCGSSRDAVDRSWQVRRLAP